VGVTGCSPKLTICSRPACTSTATSSGLVLT